MAFTFTWDVTFNTLPPDSENASLGASRIRDLKSAITERMQVDHSWTGTTADGVHLKLTMPQLAADPLNAATTGFVYTKAVGGATELFWRDAAGNIKQLTNAGKLNAVNDSFDAGTRMSFNQTAAPTGWTKDTTAALDDTAMRIVVGAVGSGGTNNFTTSLVNTKASDSYTLQIADIPGHTHTVGPLQSHYGSGGDPVVPAWAALTTDASFNKTTTTTSTGGGGGHSHGMTLGVKYNDFIIASKN